MVFDSSGNLFVSRDVTGGNFTTGDVFQLNPSNGDIIESVSSGLTCPTVLSVDPLPETSSPTTAALAPVRITLRSAAFPAGSAPTTSVYAKLPATPNANLAFTPEEQFTPGHHGRYTPDKVTGTNGPTPPTVIPLGECNSPISGCWRAVPAWHLPNRKSIREQRNVGINNVDLTTSPLTLATSLHHLGANIMIFGPDGCIYTSQLNTVYKITATNGGCSYATSL